ncbi:MAG: hypothetical protein LBH43_05630 [Treponema sp.]|nr:hypothetical protein [Treponema sp.]
MRLDTHARKKICAKIFRRYQKAGEKGKREILGGYAKTLECSRGYLARLLANRGKTLYAAAGS